jgi:hypothetical protein
VIADAKNILLGMKKGDRIYVPVLTDCCGMISMIKERMMIQEKVRPL